MNKEEIKKAKQIIKNDSKKLSKNLYEDSYTDESLEEIRDAEKILIKYVEQLENKVKEQDREKHIKDNLIYELHNIIQDLARDIDYSNLCLTVALKQEELQNYTEREDIQCSEITVIKIPIHKKIAQNIINKANLDLEIK